jgi:hypothetical protein
MVTGADDAGELAPPVLQTIATKLWVVATDWLTDAAIVEPDPTWTTSWPVVVSTIERP